MAIERFGEWIDNRHEYAREWKRKTGGKVVGFLCTHVPEELLYAAGVLPVRILGSLEPTSITEPYITSTVACPYSRDCLAQGLQGRYDYLDGIVAGNGCLHPYATYWLWTEHLPTQFSHYLWAPLSVHAAGRNEYLAAELRNFKVALEKWLGKEISPEDIDRAIEVYNTNRRLIRQVHEYRKQDTPPITGAEALELIVSSQVVDKAEHNQAVKELLDELPHRQLHREVGARLMMAGSVNYDRKLVRLIEDKLAYPATFVIEEQCTGIRYVWNDVAPQEDRLLALAIRYIHRPPCPVKDWPTRRRFPFILYLYREFKAQAVILQNQKFCQPHAYDNKALEDVMRETGIPYTKIELDVTIPAGLGTRVEAFLESQATFV